MPKYTDKDGKTVRLKKDGTPDRRKPPEHSQFKKGQSGNQSGRPAQRPNAAEVVQKVLGRKAAVVADGKKRIVDVDEAMIMSVVNNAIKSGNHRAAIDLLKIAEQSKAKSGSSPEDMEQRKVLADRIVRKLEQITEPGFALKDAGLLEFRGDETFIPQWLYDAYLRRESEGRFEYEPFEVNINRLTRRLN